MKFSVKKEQNNGPITNENGIFNDNNLHTWYTESNYDLNSLNNSLDSLKTCTITIFDTTFTDLSDNESEISFLTEPRDRSTSRTFISKEVQCSALRCDKSLDTADIGSQEPSEGSTDILESESNILETEIRHFNYEENPWEERKLFQQTCNDKIWSEPKKSSNEVNEFNILYKLLQKQSSNTINKLIKNVASQPSDKLTDLEKHDFLKFSLRTGPEIKLLNNFEERHKIREKLSHCNKSINLLSKMSHRSIGNMKNKPISSNKSVMTDSSQYHRIVDRFPLCDKSRSHFIQKEFYKANCARNLTNSKLYSSAAPQKTVIEDKVYIPPNNKNLIFKTVIHCKGEKLPYEPRPLKSRYVSLLNDCNSCPQLFNDKNKNKKQIKVVDRFIKRKDESIKRKVNQNLDNNINKIRPYTCANSDERKFEYFRKQKAEKGVYPSFIAIGLSKDNIAANEAIDYTKKGNKSSKPSKTMCSNIQNNNLDESKKSSCILSSVKKNNIKNQSNIKNITNKLKCSNDPINDKASLVIKKPSINITKNDIKYLSDSKNKLLPNNNNKSKCPSDKINFKESPVIKRSFITVVKNNLKSRSFDKQEVTIKNSNKEIGTLPKKKSSFISKSKLKTFASKLNININNYETSGKLNDKIQTAIKEDDAMTNGNIKLSNPMSKKLFQDKESNTDASKEKLTDFKQEPTKIMKTDTTITNIIPTAHKFTECRQYYVSVDSLRNKQLNVFIETNEKASKAVETNRDECVFYSSKSCGTYIANKNSAESDGLSEKTEPDRPKHKKLISYPILKNNFRLLPNYLRLKHKSNSKIRMQGANSDLGAKEKHGEIINVDLTPESKNLLEKLGGLLQTVNQLPIASTMNESSKKVDKFTSCTRQVSFTLPPQIIDTDKECDFSTNAFAGNELPSIPGPILKYRKFSSETDKAITTSTITPEVNTKDKDSQFMSSAVTTKAKFYVRPATADLVIKGETSCFYQDIEPCGLPFKNESLAKKYITSRWFSYRAIRSNDIHLSKKMMEILHKRGKIVS